MAEPKAIPLSQIAARLGCPAPAGNVLIRGVAALVDAQADDLSFISSAAFVDQFKATRAGAVLVQTSVQLHDPPPSGLALLPVENAELAIVKVLEMFAQPPVRPAPGVDSNARVDPSATLGPQVAVGPFCVIGPHSSIGRQSIIHSGVHVGDDVVIGDNCEIFPNVTIRQRVLIGNRVIIHAGSVIGSDGFGYHWDGSRHAKVPHIGAVVIEDDVEIGSCVCIDRAKFSKTLIGTGTKIDNLVQVAHNVRIGPHCVIAGQVGLAGSATLGARVALGGQSAVRDHITLGDDVKLAACAAAANDVPDGSVYSGMPAIHHRQSLREQAALRRLPQLVTQVRQLEEQIKQLQSLLQKQSKV